MNAARKKPRKITSDQQPRYVVQLAGVKKRLPRDVDGLDEFAALCRHHRRGDFGWFDLVWENPDDLAPGTKKRFVPFLKLPTGSLVGFWFETDDDNDPPRVAHVGSEGDADVLAMTLHDFVAKLAKGKTGLWDLDEDHELDEYPGPVPAGRQASTKAASKRFEKWLESCGPESDSIPADAGRALSKRLVAVCKRHDQFDDVLPCVDFVITLDGATWDPRWLIHGLQPYPRKAAKDLRPVIEDLVALLGRPLVDSELTVWRDGSVFLEKNTTIHDAD